MDCRQARRLMRANVIPGAGPGRNPYLGFHLSGCAACREFRQRMSSTPLARRLAVVRSLGYRDALPRQSSQSKRGAARLLRIVVVGVVVIFLFSGWYIGVPLVRAWDDLTAMASLETSTADLAATQQAALESPSIPEQPALTPQPIAPTPSETLVPTSSPTSTPVPTLLPSTTASATSTSQPSSTPEPSATAQPTATPKPESALVAAHAVTVLLLGIDPRPGEGTLGRSDAITVVRFDPEQKRLAMLSLPRDLWVGLPGAGEGKINSAYFLGELQGKGPALARDTVAQALGIQIDYTVVVDFTGFRSLIDALGGVPVEVPRELYDPRFPTDDYGYTIAHFKPGTEVMDGERALMFSRIRHPDSDFERMRRQQLVLIGIAHKLRERGALANVHEADRLTAALRPYVRTDIPAELALSLLWDMRTIDPATVERYVVDGSMLTEGSIGGAYVLMADQNVLRGMGAKLLAK